MNILVLCTGNSARSILLEAILNTLPGLRAWSAGSSPTGKVHPMALATLKRHGIPAGAARSKSWDEFAGKTAPSMDLVVTVCGNAASETCPVWPGAPLRAHWGVEDPAAAPLDEQKAAFETAFGTLNRRAQAFAEQMRHDLTPAALTRIGEIA